MNARQEVREQISLKEHSTRWPLRPVWMLATGTSCCRCRSASFSSHPSSQQRRPRLSCHMRRILSSPNDTTVPGRRGWGWPMTWWQGWSCWPTFILRAAWLWSHWNKHLLELPSPAIKLMPKPPRGGLQDTVFTIVASRTALLLRKELTLKQMKNPAVIYSPILWSSRLDTPVEWLFKDSVRTPAGGLHLAELG